MSAEWSGISRAATVLVASSFWAMWANVAFAAPILLVNSDGQLTGALNVEVEGTLYDVEFAGGTCIDIFSGCDEPSDLPFSTLDEARKAGQALLDTVFVDGPQGMFDLDPSTTFGCAGAPGLCTVWVPYEIAFTMGVPVDVLIVLTQNWVSHTSDFAFIASFFPTNVPTFDGTLFAQFTPAQGAPPVPEPGNVVLLGMALGGLWLRRCRVARRRPEAR